jgi:hypothetical protein
MATDGYDDPEAQLLQRYVVAAGHYSWAVAELSRQRTTATIEEYSALSRLVDEAREECETARRILRFHREKNRH